MNYILHFLTSPPPPFNFSQHNLPYPPLIIMYRMTHLLEDFNDGVTNSDERLRKLAYFLRIFYHWRPMERVT